MKSSWTTRNTAMAAMLMGVGSLIAAQATAQQLYRSVGPDGRVIYSDKPPVQAAAKTVPARSGTASSDAAGASGGALPFELRNIAQRYPVTLYTSKECAPCNSGRNALRARGIPFSERTIDSIEDAQALRNLMGSTSLPALTIGSQQLRGYSDNEWTQYLDAAGYPKASQLPSSYRAPAAQPMVARVEAPAANAPAPQATAPDAPSPAPAAAPATSPSNPAGIRF